MNKNEAEIISKLNQYKSSLMVLNKASVIGQGLIDFINSLFDLENIALFMFSDNEGVFKDISKNSSSSSPVFHVYNSFILWLSDSKGLYTKNYFLNNESLALQKEKALEYFDLTRSCVIMPLLMNNSLIGIVNIGKKRNGKDFSKQDMWLFQELQMSTSVSISNSLMYERIQALNETLEQKVVLRTQELKEAQEQLIISEKLASLGTMVAGIAHEVNTPAAVIKGSLQNSAQNITSLENVLPEIFQLQWEKKDIENTLSLLSLLKEPKKQKFIDTLSKMKRKKELRKRFEEEGVKINDSLLNFILPFENQELLSFIIDIGKSEHGDSLLEFILNNIQLNNNINNALNSVESISRLVLALKRFSHLDQAGREYISVSEGIENTLIILQNQFKKGLRLKVDLKSQKKIYGFSGELNQVWINILMNSIQALQSKYINIEDALISIRSVDRENDILVEIEDNGPGISPEKLNKIWDPFFTTKDQGEGTGLGLSIVKKIIEKHNGRIKAESEEGFGVRFSIFLSLENGKNGS